MPLVVDQLRLWTLGFKWAGLDPDGLWLRIPPMVRDNFATLLEAILKDELGCVTLQSQKWDGKDQSEARFYVRYWLDAIYDGVQSRRFDRGLLKHAVIERSDFREWCERRAIPLPTFWFPLGWTDYRWPEDVVYSEPGRPGGPAETDSEGLAATHDLSSTIGPAQDAGSTLDPHLRPGKSLRPSQSARIACQVIATNVWRVEPDKTIASMCKDERLKLGDAAFYDEVTVKRWIQQVAPAHVSARRGRPRKVNPPEPD